jgi:CelD/BcsL family acetyltransferase involved in cellulose biosynthesis
MVQVAAKTYQHALGAGFQKDAVTLRRLEAEARAGRWRAWILYAAGRPIAFRTGFVYRQCYHGASTGYDPAFARYSVGLWLLAHAVDELIMEGVRLYDWGLGDAPHKQRFGSTCEEEIEVTMYGPTLRGRVFWVAEITGETMERWLRAVLRRMGILDAVKRAERRRLACTSDG